jgi:hypothetical protein
LVVLAPISPSYAQAPPLGTAASYAILAGQTATNAPGSASVINGNLGVYPGNTCPGFSNLACGASGLGLVTGTVHLADGPAQQAQADFFNAYGVLAGDARTATLTGQDLGGKTLVAGVYFFSSTAQLTGTLTLNGQGNPNSVFIFQIGSGLTTGTGSTVLLTNGAQGGNVFWQVGSQATLGTSTTFVGGYSRGDERRAGWQRYNQLRCRLGTHRCGQLEWPAQHHHNLLDPHKGLDCICAAILGHGPRNLGRKCH